MLDDNKKIARNTVALYLRTAITMVVSFLSVRVTLQVLGSEDYGLNNLVGSVISMLSFINASMGTSVQRFLSYEIGRRRKDQLRKVFGTGLFLHICVAIITFIVAELFAFFFFHKLNIPQERLFAAHFVFQISILSMILNIICVPYGALLRAREEFGKFALLDVCQSVGRLIVLYFLYIVSYDKLITLSVLNLIITLLYAGGQVYFARIYAESRSRIDKDKQLIKEMTSFISLLLFTVLFSIMRDQGVVILINMFFGLVINAAFAIALQMMTFVNTFAMNFKQALAPQIMSAFGAGDTNRMEELIFTGTKITSILLLLITFPIICEPHFVLDIILKDVPEYAPEFTRILLIDVNISSFTYFLYQAVHATGKIAGQQVSISILYALNVFFIFILYRIGVNSYSALYVTLGCSLVQCIINLFYAKKTFNFHVQDFIYRVIIKYLFFILIVFPIPLLLSSYEESWSRFVARTLLILILIICGGIAYLDIKERAYCKNMIHSFISCHFSKIRHS